jgi:molecular chaperone GrpE
MSEPRKIKVVANEEEQSLLPENTTTETAPRPRDEDIVGSTGEPPEPAVEVASDDLKSKLEAKEKEQRETYDRLLRLTADFENYKKRMSREMEDFRKYANQSLLKEMLSVVDHIELAIQATHCASGADPGMVEGLKLTLKELLRILEKFNVKPIEAAGQPFNPQLHEAILREASNGLPENTVVREMQKGYMINDRLLRPALVVVAAPGGAKQNSTPHAC